jgi:uncharacterized protein (TIGR00369 family)
MDERPLPLTPTFTPKNPAFETLVRASFGRQPFMAYLGATLARVEPGQVHIALPFRADLTQQNGFMHAGAITSVADSACGYAAFSLCPPEHDVLAVEFKISLLAPARAPSFLACARVLRAGRTLTSAQADVYGLTGDERELVATMLSTVISRPMRGA